ncbi:MAG: Gfo/Idh/MocA family protein, partial [Pseudomonadota bacterium]
MNGLGVVGLGYWGPNWVRNLYQSRRTRKVVACDLDAKRRHHIADLYPGVETTESFQSLLEDPEIDGLVVATPVSTHYRLALSALRADKSVLVEKPLAMSRSDAANLVRLARDRGR